MTSPACQGLPIPDIGAGSGPWTSPAWIPGRIKKLTRLGMAANTTQSDGVLLFGTGNPLDPLPTVANFPSLVSAQAGLSLPPNGLGWYTGGSGEVDAEKGNQGTGARIAACKYWALVRYPAPTFPQDLGAPPATTGAFFELQGELSEASPKAFTWQINLELGVPSSLNPPAWSAGATVAANKVILLPNGGYGMYLTGGITGTTAPNIGYDGVLSDGTATLYVTSPSGFGNGIQWLNATTSTVWTGDGSGLTTTNGFGPLPAGAIGQPPTQPSETWVLFDGPSDVGTIAVEGFL